MTGTRIAQLFGLQIEYTVPQAPVRASLRVRITVGCVIMNMASRQRIILAALLSNYYYIFY